jgi:hypothetical protein
MQRALECLSPFRLSLDRRGLNGRRLMGALAGFRYKDVGRRLKALGLEFHRQAAGSHEICFNPALTGTRAFRTILVSCPKVRSPGCADLGYAAALKPSSVGLTG